MNNNGTPKEEEISENFGKPTVIFSIPIINPKRKPRTSHSYKSLYEEQKRRYDSMVKTAALGWLMFLAMLLTLIGRSL